MKIRLSKFITLVSTFAALVGVAQSYSVEFDTELPPQLEGADFTPIQKWLDKRPELNLKSTGRKPAQSDPYKEVPTGSLAYEFFDLESALSEEDHSESENQAELYLPVKNPSKWIAKKSYETNDSKIIIKKVGDPKSKERTFKMPQGGSFAFIKDLDLLQLTGRKEIQNPGFESPLTVLNFKFYDLKTGKLASSHDCNNGPKEFFKGDDYINGEVVIDNGTLEVFCRAMKLEKAGTENSDAKYSHQFYRAGTNTVLFKTDNYANYIESIKAWVYLAEPASGDVLEVRKISKDNGFKEQVIARFPKFYQGKDSSSHLSFLSQGFARVNNELYANDKSSSNSAIFNLSSGEVAKMSMGAEATYESYSISPNGKLFLISESEKGFKLFQHEKSALKELSSASTPETGLDAPLVTLTANEAKVRYSEAKFLSSASNGDLIFVAMPTSSGEEEAKLTRRARLKVFRIAKDGKIFHRMVKGSEGIIGIYQLPFTNTHMGLYFHSSTNRQLSLKDFRVSLASTNSRFRTSRVIGEGILNSEQGVANNESVKVRWDDVKLTGGDDKLSSELLKTKASFCKTTMRASSRWNKIPMPTDEEPVMTQSQVDLLKLRFQKPAGFEPHRDLKALMFLFSKVKIQDTDPEAAAGILGNVVARSELLYDYLLKQFIPYNKTATQTIRSLKANTANPCWSSTERKAIRAAAVEYFSGIFKRGNEYDEKQRTDTRLYHFGAPLKVALYFDVAADGEEATDKAAEKLADRTKQHKFFKHIFFSKLYKFAYQYVAPFFGQTPHPKIDYTVVRLSGTEDVWSEEEKLKANPSVHGFLMSTHPMKVSGKNSEGIQGTYEINSPSGYGFYHYRTGEVVLDKTKKVTSPTPISIPNIIANPKIERIVNGEKQNFNGEFKVSYLPQKDLIPKESEFSLQPSQASADKRFSGMLMFGYDLGDEEYIHDEYKAYYQDRGYKFKPETDETDVQAFAENLIREEKLDYLLKEAHSDGDEKNMFQFFKRVKVSHGVLDSGGIKQEVFLTRPNQQSGEHGVLWPNEQFGKIIEARKTPFLYFNTSCWSIGKVPFEIQASNNPKFFNIASITMVDTFYNQEDSAVLQLMNGVLEQKDFNTIRSEYLVKNPENQAGENNVFVFPGQEEYTAGVASKLSIAISLEVNMYDSKGVKMNIGDVSH